jgi:hypothetical protein
MATQWTAGLTDNTALPAATLNRIGAAWESWTPTITQGATLTKTVGYAKYTQINKLVVAHMICTITSAGTGGSTFSCSLPIAAASADAPYFGSNGAATFYDASTTVSYVLAIHMGNSSIINFVYSATGGNYFGNVPGITAANGDVLSFTINYEAA